MFRSTVTTVVVFIPVYIFLSFACYFGERHKLLTTARLCIGFLCPALVVFRAIYRRSLTKSGIIVAYVLGVTVFTVNYVFAALMISFFLIGTKATDCLDSKKRKKNNNNYFCSDKAKDDKTSTARTATQVLCNGGSIGVLCLVQLLLCGPGENFWLWRNHPKGDELTMSLVHGYVLGCLSCCCGDTLASELSTVLCSHSPVLLVMPTRKVPKGTHGGVTLIGLCLSLLGGLLLGFVDYFSILIFAGFKSDAWVSQLPVLLIASLAGLAGSMLDSILGATLQYSGFNVKTKEISDSPGIHVQRISGLQILDNNLVNLISSILTGCATAFISTQLMFLN